MRSFAPESTIVGVRENFFSPTHLRPGKKALQATWSACKGAALIAAVTVVGHALWLAFAYLASLLYG